MEIFFAIFHNPPIVSFYYLVVVKTLFQNDNQSLVNADPSSHYSLLYVILYVQTRPVRESSNKEPFFWAPTRLKVAKALSKIDYVGEQRESYEKSGAQRFPCR